MAERRKNYALMPLGEILLDLGYLTEAQWEAALATAGREGREFQDVLLAEGLVDPDRLTHALALQNTLRFWPWQKVEQIVAKHELARVPPPADAPALKHLAWSKPGGPTLVITADMGDAVARARLKAAYGGQRIEIVAVTPSTFAHAERVASFPEAAPTRTAISGEDSGPATPPGGPAALPAMEATPEEAATTLPPAGEAAVQEGESVDGYRVLRKLAEGATAEVFLAERATDGARVALKRLRASLAADDRARAYMTAECRLLEALDHPHIIRVYGGGTWDGLPYMAMELLPGETLEQRLRGGEPLPVAAAMLLWCQVSDALAYAHHMGVLHQDVKPENVLLTEAGDAKLVDFGVARAHDTGPDQDQTAAGTPLYMSPEQLKGQPLGPPSDVYALGLLAFEMLTGELPDRHLGVESMLRRRRQRSVRLDDVRRPLARALASGSRSEDLGASLTDLARVLYACLRRDPRHRMGSAVDLSKHLRQIMAIRGWRVPPELPLPATPGRAASAAAPAGRPAPAEAPAAQAGSAEATKVASLEVRIDQPENRIPPDYEVIKLLGRGSMGEVFYARDTETGRRVALKMITADMAANDRFRNRFQREAEVLGRLNHASIVHIFGVQFEGPTPHIAMEYVEGRDLDAILKERKRLSVHETVPIICAVASALEHVHSAGVIHRDLKPSNLMLTSAGQVKILDFGVAKDAEGANLTTLGAVIGTPHYMSPEQASGQAATPLSDMYALGMIWYQLLTGSVPFRGSIPEVLHMHVAIQPPHVSETVPVPEAIDRLIARMLRKRPEERPQSFREVIRIAEEAVAPPFRWGVLVRALLTAAVAIGGGVISLLLGNQAMEAARAVGRPPDATAQAGVWVGIGLIAFGLLYSAWRLVRR